MLQDAHPNAFATSISHTTRGPRPGEEHGSDYYFVKMEDFEDLIKKEGFVEHAKFGGNRYGTSREMIEKLQKEGKVVILDIEMEVCISVISAARRKPESEWNRATTNSQTPGRFELTGGRVLNKSRTQT
jgi:guanylate kinase